MQPKAPRNSLRGSRRASTRASIASGIPIGRLASLRRESIHENINLPGGTKNIKRQFYGLSEAETALNEFWKNHTGSIISFLVVLTYYLVGLVYYKSAEGWDTITCLYFQTVTLTTVGYGDFYPTTPHARVFTIFYIFAGIIIVGRILNDFAQSILDYAEKQAKLSQSEGNLSVVHHNTSHYAKKAAGPIIAILIVLLMGALFYHKNEGWDFGKAFYFCVVTTTTVGFGDTGLTKESSRIFAIFYILSSCIIVALSLGNIATTFLEMSIDKKRTDALSRKLDFQFIRELDTGDSGIDKISFLVAMLVNQGLVDKDRDVSPWLDKFDELDTKGSGVIDFDETIAELERKEQQRLEAINRQLEQFQEKERGLFGNMSLNGLLAKSGSPSKLENLAGATGVSTGGQDSGSDAIHSASNDVEHGIEMLTYDDGYATADQYAVSNPMRTGTHGNNELSLSAIENDEGDM